MNKHAADGAHAIVAFPAEINLTNTDQARTYKITFAGQAGDTIRAEFDDCTVTVRPGRTTLRAQLPDQAALWGLVQRIIDLGLDVVDMHVVPSNRGGDHRRLKFDAGDVAGPAATSHHKACRGQRDDRRLR
jgi:hypothetical protein